MSDKIIKDNSLPSTFNECILTDNWLTLLPGLDFEERKLSNYISLESNRSEHSSLGDLASIGSEFSKEDGQLESNKTFDDKKSENNEFERRVKEHRTGKGNLRQGPFFSLNFSSFRAFPNCVNVGR